MELSSQQKEALQRIEYWQRGTDQFFTLGGYAGTGKTTLAQTIRSQARCPVIFAAFTGKAASVLREKGISDATTIHNLIYKPVPRSEHKLRLLIDEAKNQNLTPEDKKDLERKIEWEKKLINGCSFENKEGVNFRQSLVVVDEYSMLDEQMVNDLSKACGKILALGDPFQLPPVRGESPLTPDFFLTEVHRQALDSPILRAATDVRNGKSLVYGDYGDFKYIPKYQATPEDYTSADQVIVARNKTRTAFNKKFRKIKGYDREVPVKGDKLICLKNEHARGIYNGIIGECMGNTMDINEDTCIVNYDGTNYQSYRGNFLGHTPDPEYRGLSQFDYAYAITCHKSQGSEFDKVTVYQEDFKQEPERWLYTAITRAKQKLTIVDSEEG